MTTIDILDLKGSSTDKIDIPEEITSLEVNTNILHMEVKRFLASSRSGTSKAKGLSLMHIQMCIRDRQSGELAGYPVIDVKATLLDGSYHDEMCIRDRSKTYNRN